MSKSRRKRGETPSIGSDESGCKSCFATTTIAIVKLTQEKIDLIKRETGFENFYKFATQRDKTKDKNPQEFNYFFRKLTKILKHEEDYEYGNMKEKTFEKILEQSESWEEVLLTGHRFLHKKLTGSGLKHVIDRFWKQNDERSKEFLNAFAWKPVSNGPKTYMSIAIAEVLAFDYARYKHEQLNIPIDYNESHKEPIVMALTLWNNSDEAMRKKIKSIFEYNGDSEFLKKYLNQWEKKKQKRS